MLVRVDCVDTVQATCRLPSCRPSEALQQQHPGAEQREFQVAPGAPRKRRRIPRNHENLHTEF